MFSYGTQGQHFSPFILLDYAGPAEFSPAEKPRGVGEHPHRGFETVTIVYQGEVEHRDSTGKGGVIGPGDVQWMTAASGILHQEMVQLWVNLPARDKNAAPGYQTLLDRAIPAVTLLDEAGALRVIAGEYQGHRGPARTFTPINVWDLRLRQGGATSLTPPEGQTVGVVVLRGAVLVNGSDIARETQFVLLGRTGGEVTLEANNDATVLILSGEPIDEPVVMHGPFVMNTADEITQAIVDFQSGRFGAIGAEP